MARTLLRNKNKKMDRKRRHAETNSDAAEIIAGNIDLIMEIIVRLPAKLLLRFQLVSKDWRSALSCPAFCRRHTLRQRRRVSPFLILRDSSQRRFFFLNPQTRVFLPYRFNFPYSFTKILQCCNGLMLLECKSSPYGQKLYIVHNPTTWESREVPIEHKRREMSFRLAGLCLAYDPAISPNYRVVCVKNKRPDFLISIFDSESRNWTEIEQPFFSTYSELKFWNGIYGHNVIYWFRPTSDSFYFDLGTGKHGRLPRFRVPLRKERYTTRCNVLESNGHLYCIFLYMHKKEHQRKYFMVFELREYNADWVTYRVDVTGPSHALWEIEGAIAPLAIVRGEMEGDFTILFHVDGKLISYRFAAGTYDVVVELRREEEKVAAQTEGRSRLQFQSSDTFQFVDSLVPV